MIYQPIYQGLKLLPFNASRLECTRLLSLSKVDLVVNKHVFEAKRSARMMKKIMSGSRSGARKADSHHYNPSKQLSEFGFMNKGGASARAKPVSGKVMRRVEVLNNLFIEQITSLLATGEIAPEFLGLGIQISKVKVTPDFSAVNVYWYASGTEKDEYIEKLLARCAGHLRHTLTQLRVIGIVPPILFFKDRTFSKIQEVEMMLSKCDLDKSLDSEEVITIKEEPVLEDLMTHNILGLPHDRIMNRVKNCLQQQSEKKKAREQSLMMSSILDDDNPGDADITNEMTSLEQEVKDHRQRQHEFLRYLKKQRAEKSKELKRISVEAKEKEFQIDEKEARKTAHLQNRLDELDDLSHKDNDEYSGDEDGSFEDETESYYQNMRQDFK